MQQDRRHAVVSALVELAASGDYRDRADAGRALTSFAEAPESRATLLRLVLVVDDTFVTLVTAEALLRRQDTAGIAIVAEALATADDQHSTQIYEAARTVFMVFSSERDQAMETCEALSLDASAQVRQGAAALREMLAEIQPVLYPQEPVFASSAGTGTAHQTTEDMRKRSVSGQLEPLQACRAGHVCW